MTDKDIRRSFWDQPRITPHYTAQMQNFLDAAASLGFETRYIGEQKWWPVGNEEVAQTLGKHYEDLLADLSSMLDGAVLRSPVAEFRIADKSRMDSRVRNFAFA